MTAAYLLSKSFPFLKKAINCNGRILILAATVGEYEHVLSNLYNAKNEQEQVNTLTNLQGMQKELNSDDSK